MTTAPITVYESDPWRGLPAAPPNHSMRPGYSRAGSYDECRWCGTRKYPGESAGIDEPCAGIEQYRRLTATRRIARRIRQD